VPGRDDTASKYNELPDVVLALTVDCGRSSGALKRNPKGLGRLYSLSNDLPASTSVSFIFLLSHDAGLELDREFRGDEESTFLNQLNLPSPAANPPAHLLGPAKLPDAEVSGSS